MSSQMKLHECLRSLENLFGLVEKYGGENCTPGLRLLLGVLTDSSASSDVRLESGAKAFKGMLGGAGTLGDFVIWHPDEQIRAKLNEQLEFAIAEVWDFLNPGSN